MWLKITGFLFYLIFIFISMVLGAIACVYSYKAYSALLPEAATYDTLKSNLNFARIFSLTITIIIFVGMATFFIASLIYFGLNSSASSKGKTEAETSYQWLLFLSLLFALMSLIGITFLTITFIAINVLLQLATALPSSGITSTRNNGSWIILYSSLAFLSTLIAGAGLIVFMSSSSHSSGASDEEIKMNKLNEQIKILNQNLINLDKNSKIRYNELDYDIDKNYDMLNILSDKLGVTQTDRDKYDVKKANIDYEIQTRRNIAKNNPNLENNPFTKSDYDIKEIDIQV